MLRYTGHALLLMLGAIFVFHSPFARWWAGLNLPWYTVFVLWLLLIVLVALDSIKGDSDSSRSGDQRGRREANQGDSGRSESGQSDSGQSNSGNHKQDNAHGD